MPDAGEGSDEYRFDPAEAKLRAAWERFYLGRGVARNRAGGLAQRKAAKRLPVPG